MKVIILRGLPGSGKSRWARDCLDELEADKMGVVCSADDFFVDEDGFYRFDPLKLSAAHGACFMKFLKHVSYDELHDGTHLLLVDNTNLTAWEIAPYYQLAALFGCDVEIVTLHCPWEIAAQRNTHGVPPEKVWAMWQTLQTERLPGHWKGRIVFSGA